MKATDIPTHYNAIDILERNLAENGENIALYTRDREMTFRMVADEVNQIGNTLLELGVRFGDMVGILAPDCAEWATSFFGVIKIGAIAVCLNTALESDELKYLLHDSRAQVLIIHESLLPIIEPIRHQAGIPKHILVIGNSHYNTDLIFQSKISASSTQLNAASTHRDDFCSLHYSSGTTGKPKGILHSHKDYQLIAQNSGIELLDIKKTDRTFSTAKLFFVYGLGGNLIFPWYAGAASILHSGPSRMVPAILAAIRRFHPTILYSVPTNYAALLATSQLGKETLSSLRLCISAGETLPRSTWQDWKTKTDLEILDTIGCTETLHTFMANRPGQICSGSSGWPSPGYEVKIVDDNGLEVSQGTTGNLMVKGESLALFYYHQYEKSRQSFCGEWFLTGDKYYVDRNGYYWHTGRADDMFKVGGLWVSPVEVENVLAEHPAVKECAIVGQQESSTNKLVKPKAIVCLNTDFMPTEKLTLELLRHCKTKLSIYKIPRWVKYTTELPKTATGKIQRFKLRSSKPYEKISSLKSEIDLPSV